ncbi:MAG: hypothetical protein ABIN37_14050 [Burkholderiaceae bacterium]
MGPIDSLNHLFNFVLPALALALCMAGPVRRFMRRKAPLTGFWPALAVHFGLGVLVLALGLWVFERDGMVLTYALLVVTSASTQWVMDRRWRS